MILSEDSLAMILLCSNFMVSNKTPNAPKPFTLKEWDVLSTKLKDSPLERPKAFFKSSPVEWQEHLQLNEEQIERIQRLLALGGQLGIELERLKSLGIWVTTRAEVNYPPRLKKILRSKSPVVLYGAGDINLCNNDMVAIVGSRDVDNEGTIFAERLAHKCALEGLGVVSGGSRGVDMIAQTEALNSSGRVVAVLSEALESSIKKREIRTPVSNGKLLLLSAWHPKSRFTSFNAMERNKHIYALSNYSVVVSSAENKGGTWSGAKENLRNNWVSLFVRSGGYIPSGNKKLIEMGGIPLDNGLLLDNKISIKSWFAEKASTSPIQKTMLQKNRVNDDTKQIEIKFGSTPKSDGHNEFVGSSSISVDLFMIVWPYIQKLLETPRNEVELAQLLNIRDNQIHDWLNRAINDGKVEKLSEQGKYIVSPRLRTNEHQYI